MNIKDLLFNRYNICGAFFLAMIFTNIFAESESYKIIFNENFIMSISTTIIGGVIILFFNNLENKNKIFSFIKKVNFIFYSSFMVISAVYFSAALILISFKHIKIYFHYISHIESNHVLLTLLFSYLFITNLFSILFIRNDYNKSIVSITSKSD